jgi:hypothetical protein
VSAEVPSTTPAQTGADDDGRTESRKHGAARARQFDEARQKRLAERRNQDLVLETGEIDAILAAVGKVGKLRDNLGPRAVRAFLFRYQLARMLLEKLNIDWDAEELAEILVQRSMAGKSNGTISRQISGDLESVIRQVS